MFKAWLQFLRLLVSVFMCCHFHFFLVIVPPGVVSAGLCPAIFLLIRYHPSLSLIIGDQVNNRCQLIVNLYLKFISYNLGASFWKVLNLKFISYNLYYQIIVIWVNERYFFYLAQVIWVILLADSAWTS